MEHVKLNYAEFISELRRLLYQAIPEDMDMEVHRVLKNNSVRRDSLVLTGGGSRVSPNFYLQDYYRCYAEGEDIGVLAGDIYGKWQELAEEALVMPDVDSEGCREFIVYRLIHAGRNREFLEEVPHIPFFDLAVTFYYVVESGEDGVRSIRVSNELMDYWKLNTQQLLQLAGKNTPRLFPARYSPFQEALQDVFTLDVGRQPAAGEGQPWLLTNNVGINGAASWLYPDQLEGMSQKHRRNFYILPSSIHELIIIMQEEDGQEKQLLQMVRQVNRECVKEEDFLSDNIYFYDYRKKGIKMISG